MEYICLREEFSEEEVSTALNIIPYIFHLCKDEKNPNLDTLLYWFSHYIINRLYNKYSNDYTVITAPQEFLKYQYSHFAIPVELDLEKIESVLDSVRLDKKINRLASILKEFQIRTISLSVSKTHNPQRNDFLLFSNCTTEGLRLYEVLQVKKVRDIQEYLERNYYPDILVSVSFSNYPANINDLKLEQMHIYIDKTINLLSAGFDRYGAIRSPITIQKPSHFIDITNSQKLCYSIPPKRFCRLLSSSDFKIEKNFSNLN